MAVIFLTFTSMSAVDSPHSKVQGSGVDEHQTILVEIEEQNNFHSHAQHNSLPIWSRNEGRKQHFEICLVLCYRDISC